MLVKKPSRNILRTKGSYATPHSIKKAAIFADGG